MKNCLVLILTVLSAAVQTLYCGGMPETGLLTGGLTTEVYTDDALISDAAVNKVLPVANEALPAGAHEALPYVSYENNIVNLSGIGVKDNTEPDKKPPVINALAAVVVEESSGRVLYAKNATQKRSIASTTKIMTALVALENGHLENEVTVSRRASSIGGSTIGLREGEKYTLREMLYAMLLVSSTDAATAIAEHIGGTVEGFANMMNSKAKSIGAMNSHFVTPHGLDRENQYSTAYDVAIITIEALKNPVFAEIVSTKSSYIPGHGLYNTNELLGNCTGVDGVKTGYTGKAGRCLVTTAMRDGMRLVSVVLGSPTRNARASASRDLLQYCFDSFSMHRLLYAGDVFTDVPVYMGVKNHAALSAEQGIELPLSRSEAESLEMIKSVPDILKAPVYAGTDAGFIEYSLNGEVLAESILKTSENIRRKTYLDYLNYVLSAWGRIMREGVFAQFSLN